MSWYKKYKKNSKPMPLDPEGYSYDDRTHRLQQDNATQYTPYGKVKKQVDPNVLTENYRGVHASQEKDLAAIYANNKATKNDPPVVIEFVTNKKWEPDIDSKTMFVQEAIDRIQKIPGFMDYLDQLADEIPGSEPDWDYIDEVFSFIESGKLDQDAHFDNDYFGSYNDDHNIANEISSRSKRLSAQDIADFFRHYYDDNYLRKFYYRFVEPAYTGVAGNIDPKLFSYALNQMRFQEPIVEDEIVSIEQIERFDPNLYNPSEELPNYDEEGRKLLSYDDYEFSPSYQAVKTIYEAEDAEQMRQSGKTYYHGTTLNRAKKALNTLIKEEGVSIRQVLATSDLHDNGFAGDDDYNDYNDYDDYEDYGNDDFKEELSRSGDEGFVYDADSGRHFWGSQASGILFVRKINNTPEILLTLRSNEVEDPNTWGVPGGAVPPGEDPLESAMQETVEEFGSLPGNDTELLGKTSWKPTPESSFTFNTFVIFLDEEWTPKEFNWETSDAKWVPVEKAQMMSLHPGLRDVLKDIQAILHNIR